MPLETNLSQYLGVFSYLKNLTLGDKITICTFGVAELVVLIRRGRQTVTIEGDLGDRRKIPLSDVMLPD